MTNNLAKKKTESEQVAMLNTFVRVRLAPSKVHGIGVFAIRDIPKDTRIYADNMPEIFDLPHKQFSNLYPEVRELLLERWPQIINGSAFLYPDARMLAYMNHADVPNYDNKTDRTLRDIAQGEELFEDYRAVQGYAHVFPWLDKK